jgi:hypothetical protein
VSYATFLASDIPLPALNNQHKHLLSVNEALGKGIDVPNYVLESNTIDRDKPGVILWVDCEENLGEITIASTERPYYFTDDYGNPPDTSLPRFSSLEWNYTKERAGRLIEYIRKHLETAAVVEIWNYWIGSGRDISEGMTKHNTSVDELAVTDLEKLFSYDEQYDCITIKRT